MSCNVTGGSLVVKYKMRKGKVKNKPVSITTVKRNCYHCAWYCFLQPFNWFKGILSFVKKIYEAEMLQILPNRLKQSPCFHFVFISKWIPSEVQFGSLHNKCIAIYNFYRHQPAYNEAKSVLFIAFFKCTYWEEGSGGRLLKGTC